MEYKYFYHQNLINNKKQINFKQSLTRNLYY